jgi:CubicO group peptidase (beta-lactamase class C family)
LELEQTAAAQMPESPAYWPTEGWQSSTPEQQGMNSEQLAKALDFLQEQDDFNIHSLLIIRNGYIVTDAYFYPFAQGSVHDTASVTKSFTATLIGITIGEGYITSVQQPVLDFFPERTVANVDVNKEAMTLEDLLTMRSGFECTEVTSSQMRESPDWVQFTLDLPMAEEPGTSHVYCNSNTHLLSAIIRETTGLSALAFGQEHLFEPLGISDADWPYSDPQGNNHGWGDLFMTPHDMAKLGYLYLHEGVWDDKQVLPATWVAAATSPATSLPACFPHDHYGYLWWLNSSDSYYLASGWGGQTIFVFPDQDMIIVTTGGDGRDVYGILEVLLTSYIIPAAESKTPLPANPDGVALLDSIIQQAAAPPQAEPVPLLPEMSHSVSGQTYVLDANPFGFQSFSLTFQEENGEALLSVTLPENQELDYLVGLDNVSRITPAKFGIPAAAKGWWESENVFVIHLDETGNINRWRISATFEDDQVTVQMQDLTGIDDVTLVGQLEDAPPPTPAFEAIFAIAGILAIVWLLGRRK